MVQPNSGEHRAPATDATGKQPAKSPAARYDLGALLKENPHLYRITQLCGANVGYLRLGLQKKVVFSTEDFFFQFVALDCVNAVDYSIRPADPATLEGGPCIEYHEKHELLQTVSRGVPNTDGMEMFDPAIQFTLLRIDQSYIIAQHFEMGILSDGVTNTIGRTPIQKQQKMESLKRALDSIDKYRLLP